jgi:hypothetical protein
MGIDHIAYSFLGTEIDHVAYGIPSETRSISTSILAASVKLSFKKEPRSASNGDAHTS